ncbi:class I SAM-dependent DNA methyltransferase [Kribbella endophytica]
MDSAREALAAFDPLATYYDQFTQFDNYELWSTILSDLLTKWGAPGKSLLDVACGTGKSALAMAARGYKVTGCDLSSSMLAIAHSKTSATSIRFFASDMRALDEVEERFDVVNCMDDALNFLLTEEDVLAAFESAYRVLNPGGLYVFDCNTLKTYRTWYSSAEVTALDDVMFVWQGHSRPDHAAEREVSADLYIFERASENTWTRSSSPHAQRHYSPGRVESLLVSAGFKPLAMYGFRSDGKLEQPINETDVGKFIAIARRETSPAGALGNE